MDQVKSQISQQAMNLPSLIGMGVVAFASYAWFFWKVKANPKYCSTSPDKQTVPVAFEDSKHVRANPQLIDQPIQYFEKEAQTLYEVFLRGLKQSGNGPCLGWRPGPNLPYQWITYQETLDRVKAFGSGLIALGANTNPDQFIGIFAQNSVEWKVAEQTCNCYSMVVVPLYDTLGKEATCHIVNQCSLNFIVVDKLEKVSSILSEVNEGFYKLGFLISVETPTPELLSRAEELGVTLKQFSDVEKMGSENLVEFVPPKPEDLHTICYTSGTTGLPKGAMLTHRNLTANVAGVYAIGCKTFFEMGSDDVMISYLPLAHVFERVMQLQMYFGGGRVGFFQGDIKLLIDDVAALRPTVFPMVPRLINRMYDKITSGAAESFIKNILLNRALKSKMALLNNGVVTKGTFWDRLVFRKVQNMMGGRLRICVTGAAPISKEVLNFMRCALGVYFTEGYGQTEATAAISVSLPGDYDSGSVGTPVLSNVVKLVDVPEKNYYADQGKGEVCAKGTNIFQGYYKDPEKTREALDEDGWLHTGDVGTWLPNGALKIIDRKKHIFKLAQGEYIAPEKIEGILVQSAPVAQVFIHGESLKSSLVSVVVPNVETFVAWCRSKGVNGSYEELCSNEAAAQLVLGDMCEIGKKRGLLGFELPKKVHLSTELFSVQNNLLTPTFKARRPQIAQAYQSTIEEMYKDLN